MVTTARRLYVAVWACGAVLASVAGCAGASFSEAPGSLGSGAVPSERPLLKVGPRTITELDVYRRVLRRFGNAEILWGIATEELFRLAAAEHGIRLNERQIRTLAERKYEAFREQENQQGLTTELLKRGILSEESLKETFEEEARSELLIKEVVRRYRPLDEKALREYYRRTYAQRRALVRRIAFPILPDQDKKKARKLAEEVCRRLRAGERWEEVVRPYLEVTEGEPIRAVGGDQWWIGEQEDYPRKLKDLVFSRKAGDITDPVWEEDFGWHVFAVEETLPALPFSQCLERMRREISDQPPTPEEIQEVVADLESRYPIEFFTEALQKTR